jgi:NitT/TauT family transport system ATP-binding protein
MISIRDVSRQFKSSDGGVIHALDKVSIDVGQHEFISLVGPSGCGKSTLLRLIAGLLPPSSGEVEVSGETVHGPRVDTGLVFQSPTLLPWASIEENLLFPLRMLHRPVDAAARQTAAELLELVGLGGYGGRRPSELSGGMQQRAAICRALMHDPETLLMDEPFGALDALTREEMSLELLRVCAQRPKTVVFVTHSITEAVLLSDRVVVMSARPGRVQEVIDVPLPRPRTFAMERDNEFQDRVEHIRGLIFGERAAA